LSSDLRVALLRVRSCVLAQHPPVTPLGATALTGTTTATRGDIRIRRSQVTS
jgi:hypothetical protein